MQFKTLGELVNGVPSLTAAALGGPLCRPSTMTQRGSRRSARGEDDTIRGNSVPLGLLHQARELQHTLQPAGLETCLVGETPECPVRSV